MVHYQVDLREYTFYIILYLCNFYLEQLKGIDNGTKVNGFLRLSMHKHPCQRFTFYIISLYVHISFVKQVDMKGVMR